MPALSGAPEDSYLRLDAEVSRRWVANLGDSPLVIAPYVRVLNALDRRDALFYRTGPDEGDQPPRAARFPARDRRARGGLVLLNRRCGRAAGPDGPRPQLSQPAHAGARSPK